MRRLRYWWRVMRAGYRTVPAIAGYVILAVGGSVALALPWGRKHLLWAMLLVLLAVVVVTLEGSYQLSERLELDHANDLARLRTDNQNALNTARGSAQSAAASELLRIEQDRQYEAMRPVLEGRVVPWPGQGDERHHRLEVHLKTPWPLAVITLNVPGDAWFSASIHAPPVGMSFLMQFPEPGRPPSPIRRGQPARWPVRVSDTAVGAVMAFARCRNEYGQVWEDVEVPISLDTT